MGLVAAKCTQCGANIEVDETKEAGICKYCGTAFITEKTINNYKISAEKVVVNGENINISNYDIDSALVAVEKLINGELYDDAKKMINQIIENCPYDYRGWWQMALLEYNQDRYWFDDNKNYQKALALADNPDIIKKFRNKEYDRIWEEGQTIIEFCKNPNVNMLDKIYISVGGKYELDSHLGTKYLGLEIIENQLKQVEYEKINGNYSKWDKGVVTLKPKISAYNSKVVGVFYDENEQEISNLYISDIINSEIALSGMSPIYYNSGNVDHIMVIQGDLLVNLHNIQPFSSDTKFGCATYIGIIIICVLIIIGIIQSM